MATVSDIVASQAAAISAAYSAAESKNADIPAVTSAENLADTIMTIPDAGSGGWIGANFSKAYAFDSATGTLSYSTGDALEIRGIKTVDSGSLYGFLAADQNIKEFALPSVETVRRHGMMRMCNASQFMTTLSLPSLKRVAGVGGDYTGTDSGEHGLDGIALECSSLTDVDLGYLGSKRDEDGNACGIAYGTKVLFEAFKSCTSLPRLDLSGIVDIYGVSVTEGLCNGCTSLESFSMANLKTLSCSNSFNSAFLKCTSLKKVDLRSLTNPQNVYKKAQSFRTTLGATFLSGTTALEVVYFNKSIMDTTIGGSTILQDITSTKNFGSTSSSLQFVFVDETSEGTKYYNIDGEEIEDPGA